MTDKPPKRRRFQYGLRTLLMAVLLVSICMSWLGVKLQRARRQREVVETVQRAGGLVYYRYKDTSKYYLHLSSDFKDPPIPAWLLDLLGTDFFMRVSDISLRTPNEFGNEQMRQLTELADLEDLQLVRTQVTDAGLVHLKQLTRLSSLYLNGTQATDAGLVHLEGVSWLHYLDLSGTQVTDEGLRHVKDHTTLRELELKDTRITDNGLECLKELTSLGELDLDGTQVSDVGMEHLKGLTNLQELSLNGTQITEEGVKQVKEALPNCSVLWLPTRQSKFSTAGTNWRRACGTRAGWGKTLGGNPNPRMRHKRGRFEAGREGGRGWQDGHSGGR